MLREKLMYAFNNLMEKVKQLGKKVLEVSLAILAIFLYMAVLIGPPALFPNDLFMALWVVAVILATMYGVVVHAIASEKDKSVSYFQRFRTSFPEATKKFFIVLGIIAGLTVVGALMQEDEEPAYTPPATVPSTYTAPTYVPARTYSAPVHYDSDYKYNYRSGYSGSYEYNYDVEGYSDSGDYFYGEVDTQDKYGEGYIYDEDGNEIYVETEWTGYGELEATDEYGNTYEFEVD